MAVPDLPDLIKILKLTGQYFTFDGRWANVLVALQTLSIFIITAGSLGSVLALFFGGLRSEQTTAHLKRLAAHQQALFKLSLKIRTLFGLPFFVQNLFGALCICSLLYVISSDDSNNSLLLTVYVANLLAVLAMLGGSAYVGQHVKNKTSEVFDALYEMNWYELRPSDRRYLVTMLSASREPFRIHFCGLLPLDMQNFMRILNTSYSYFMFLKSMM